MQMAQVVGAATATVKHKTMAGTKLLVVQPLMADGASADGNPLLAVDQLGAGRGDRVLITSDGALVQTLLGDTTPVRWSVLGLCDE
ncbi:MAG: EutN/CcmL family microcompartment protein [Pirellulales bacterium]|nr:EutN/CcmL family microcompartment protein [Pirellulales bacterium]